MLGQVPFQGWKNDLIPPVQLIQQECFLSSTYIAHGFDPGTHRFHRSLQQLSMDIGRTELAEPGYFEEPLRCPFGAIG